MTVVLSPFALVLLVLAAPAVCAVCAAAGAFVYHCGAKGKSPVPSLTTLRRGAEPAKEEKQVDRRPAPPNVRP